MQSPQSQGAQQVIQLQQPAQAQAAQSGIQIVQQIVTPSGEIQQIPVIKYDNNNNFYGEKKIFIDKMNFQIQLTPQQLQMIRMQVQGGNSQPIIIQAAPIQAQPQLIQVAQGGQTPMFLQTTSGDAE